MMKKILLLLYIIIPLTTFCLTNRGSQTFLFPRPAHHNIAANMAFWHNIIYRNSVNIPINIQGITFYQQSQKNPGTEEGIKLSEYFLFKNKNELTVKGDKFKNAPRDIRAEWLELPFDFNGSFTLFPTQKQVGFLVDLKGDLGKMKLGGCFENIWIGASISWLSVKNKLHLSQNITSNQPPGSPTILSALSRPELKFGKFLCESSSTGFTDMKAKFGTEFLFRDNIQVNAHSYILIPLIEPQSDRQLFEAFRGFNGHAGLGTVLDFQCPLTYDDSSYLIAFYLDLENILLFRRKEVRTFDLINKPYSRFLLLNQKDGFELNVPAINILSREVKVKPYNVFDFSVGFRFKQSRFDAEFGYVLWGHGNETVKLRKKFPDDFGIAAADNALTPEGTPATASKSTIAKLAATDKDAEGNNIFIPITESDINFCSGISRSTLTHRIHVAIGSSNRGGCANSAFGAGIFYEFPQNNGALQQFGFWAKACATF